MRHALTIIFTILACAMMCSVQPDHRSGRNALFFEVGKTGLIYNPGFDHKFKTKDFGFRFIAGSNFSPSVSVLHFSFRFCTVV